MVGNNSVEEKEEEEKEGKRIVNEAEAEEEVGVEKERE